MLKGLSIIKSKWTSRGLALVLLTLLFSGCASEEERFTRHLETAESFQDEGNVKAAIIELRNALQLVPTSAEVNFRLAKIHHQDSFQIMSLVELG